MTTKTVQARHISTRDSIVTGGEGNPLSPGMRRIAWKVSEARHIDGVSSFRMVAKGAAHGGGDAWMTFKADSKDRLRVTT